MGKHTVKIKACGDILLADFFFNIGYGIGSLIKKQDADFLFDGIKKELKDCDFLLGNLECLLSNQSINSGLRGREFLAEPQVVDALVRSGFNGLSVANNHICQHGTAAFRDTVNLLVSEGILALGYIPKNSKQQVFHFKEIKGKKFGFLAYSFVDDHFTPDVHHYAYKPSRDDLLKEISKGKENCDILIVTLHWGEEFVSVPSQEQITLAHQMIDTGCDVILGSHPHVLQGVEIYKGKTIAYSLGNFVFSMPLEESRMSIILTLLFDTDNSQSYETTPVWIDDNNCPTVKNNGKINKVRHKIVEVTNGLKMPSLDKLEYGKLIDNGLSGYRAATKKQFIRNFFKISPGVSLQLILEFIGRRFKHIFHLNNKDC